MKFEQPYFVTKHAMERFKEHIVNLPRNEIIDIILKAPQEPKRIKGMHGVYYGGLFSGKPFYIPINMPVDHKEQNWPIVPTILGPESSLHRKIMAERRKRHKKRLLTMFTTFIPSMTGVQKTFGRQ